MWEYEVCVIRNYFGLCPPYGCWWWQDIQLLLHLVLQWYSEGYTPINLRHQEAFSLDDSQEDVQPQPPSGWRTFVYRHETLSLVILKLTLPLIFVLCQVVFWCRVAAISTNLQGLVPFVCNRTDQNW